MRRTIFFSSLACATALSGCTVHHVRTQGTVAGSANVSASASANATPTYVTVAQPPPPLKEPVQVRPQVSASAGVWVEGYWSWQGGGWSWVEGHYDTPPQAGYVWEPPVAVTVDGGGYQYHRGYWRGRNEQPPAIYRTEGTIRVHTRRREEPETVSRVVVRAGERPQSRVVVRTTEPRGRSASVVVRGNATVGTNNGVPANRNDGRTTVRVRGNGNAATPATPAVPANRNDGPTATVRVRGNVNGNAATPATPAVPANRNDGPTATVRVRGNAATPATPAVPANRNDGPTATVRVRGNAATPATPAVPANRNDGPTATVRVRGNAATPATPAVRANPNDNATAAVRVNTPGGASVGAAPRVSTGSRSCNLQVAVLPRNGVIVIRGNGLGAATGVTIGGVAVPMLDKRDDRVRARVEGRANGGAVAVQFGNESASCGSVRLTGR